MGAVVDFPIDLARPPMMLALPDPMNFPPQYPDAETEDAVLWLRLFTYGKLLLARQPSIDAAKRLQRRGLVLCDVIESDFGQGPKEYLLVRRSYTAATAQSPLRA